MSLAESTLSATDRPLGLRVRGDLQFAAQRHGGRRLWAVKDPLALKYYHLREEEYVLLRLLDGRTSLDDLRRRASEAFAPRRLSVEQIQGYLSSLHRFGLVTSDAPGQGEQLLLRRGEKRRQQWLETLVSLLAIRFPGINPRRLLDGLSPAAGWLFSPLCVAVVFVLAVAAATLVAVEFATVEKRLPEFDAIVTRLEPSLAGRHAGGDQDPARAGACRWPAAVSAANATRWASCCWCSPPACTATSPIRGCSPANGSGSPSPRPACTSS